MRTEVASPPISFEVREGDLSLLEESHALLQRNMGAAGVEDIDSYRKSLSAEADPLVVPAMICGLVKGRVIGTAVGAYLVEPNLGFVAYGAVEEAWRGRGVYTVLRERLVEGIRRCSVEHGRSGPSYVVSEMDADSFLLRRYVERGAYVAEGGYEQPAEQGLPNRPMKLVLQPVEAVGPPGPDEARDIVRQVYARLYRIRDVESHPVFIRVAQSIRRREDGR